MPVPAGGAQHPGHRPRELHAASRAAQGLAKDACGKCKEACRKGAIDYDTEDTFIKEEVGAIVVATGFQLYVIGREQPEGLKGYGEYGYGKMPDVIDGLQFERLASASGPTAGDILRPSDGKEPKTVVFIQCVGSRDPDKGIDVLLARSAACTPPSTRCSTSTRCTTARPCVFYMDIRAAGKGYDEFSPPRHRGGRREYMRGRVSKHLPRRRQRSRCGAPTRSAGEQVEIDADMVVLATAIRPQPGIEQLAQKLNISYDEHGFFNEAHPKLRPVETNTAGVFLAGACQAPRDIPDSVAMASAAGGKVMGLFSADELEREPTVAASTRTPASAACTAPTCAPTAPSSSARSAPSTASVCGHVAYVNPGVCQGCGTCQATCLSKSVELQTFTDEQIYSEINALCFWE